MAFQWEQRAKDLGYITSRAMLQDLLLKQDLSWDEAREKVGCCCKRKATKLGIKKQKQPGGDQRSGTYLIDQICSEGDVQKLLDEEGNIEGAARRLGVGKETLRRWIRRKDNENEEEDATRDNNRPVDK